MVYYGPDFKSSILNDAVSDLLFPVPEFLATHEKLDRDSPNAKKVQGKQMHALH